MMITEVICGLPICSWAGNHQPAVSLCGALRGRQEEVDIGNLKFYIKIDIDFSVEESKVR